MLRCCHFLVNHDSKPSQTNVAGLDTQIYCNKAQSFYNKEEMSNDALLVFLIQSQEDPLAQQERCLIMAAAKIPSSNHTMCYIIAYDISDDRRRTKIHKVLSGFGTWTQYSLFECFLSRKELVLLKSKLARHIDESQDSVRFYPLCATCLEKVETVGGQPPTEDLLFVV